MVIILSFIIVTNLILIFIFIISIKFFSLNFLENQRIEDFFLIIPIVFLIFIGFPRIKNLYICEELNDSDLTVKINGHQWYWSYNIINFNLNIDSIMRNNFSNFRLLETFNHLIIPINCSIRFIISSEDVIHSWTVPSIGIKVDAIPGRINQISSIINRPGVFLGQCREICGTNHSFIPIVISANSINNLFNYNNKYFFQF